jgi:hypothetical protein
LESHLQTNEGLFLDSDEAIHLYKHRL